MKLTRGTYLFLGALALVPGGYLAWQSQAQGNLQTAAVEMTLKDRFDVPAADAQTTAIVAAATAFLATLDDSQRKAASFALDDNVQRANWSNFPEGMVTRSGVRFDSLSEAQRTALFDLLGTLLSPEGVRNIRAQMAGEDSLDPGGVAGASFGSAFYYAAFLGTPSATAPWTFQFGGHHLAINATVFGPDISFSPMLTGGQPLRVTLDGQKIYTTARETEAAAAFLASLTPAQKAVAVQGADLPGLIFGPVASAAAPVPAGIAGAELDPAQKALLLDVIAARFGHLNADDARAMMERASAGLDATTFGWWGPEGTPGAAYFRISGPDYTLEYSPETMGGDPTDHAHNIFRDHANDYGAAWIAER